MNKTSSSNSNSTVSPLGTDNEGEESNNDEIDMHNTDLIDNTIQAREAVAPHAYLLEDVGMVKKAHEKTERDFSIPSAAIEPGSAVADCTVCLAFDVGEIPEPLRRAWELDDCIVLKIAIQNVNKAQFRRSADRPRATARKYPEPDTSVKFAAGEALSNLAQKMLDKEYQVTELQNPSLVGSFFTKLYNLLSSRLPSISEYCLLCGETLSSGGIMISICERDLCAFQFQTLGICDGLTTPRVHPDVLSLLLIAMSEGNGTTRRDLFFKPDPPIKDQEKFREEMAKLSKANGTEVKPNSLSSPFLMLRPLKSCAPCPKTILSSAATYKEFRQQWPRTAELIEWLVISNRSYLEPVPRSMEVAFLKSKHQFLFISDTPSKQAEFDDLVRANGGKTRFFFHGSPAGNWHSIIRTGLKNMSNTDMMTTGAAHGPGIYLSPDLHVSYGYASYAARPSRKACLPTKCCLHEDGSYNIVALVEVVDAKDAFRETAHPSILVANHDKFCSIRMLLLYDSTHSAEIDSVSLKEVKDCDRESITKVMDLFKTADVLERTKHQ